MRDKAVPQPIDFPRADPTALAQFDPDTKVCTMNCGPHIQDPRSSKERKFLCDDCLTRAAPESNLARAIKKARGGDAPPLPMKGYA